MQSILFITILIQLSFGQPSLLGFSVLHPPTSSSHSSSILFNRSKRKYVSLINHSKKKTVANLEGQFLHVVKEFSVSKSSGQLFFDAFRKKDEQVLSYIFANHALQKDVINAFIHEDFKKLKAVLYDAISSNSDDVVDLLLSSGRFSREDIFDPFELESMFPRTISVIMNNPHAQQTLTDDDFEDLFLALVKKKLLFLVNLNEKAKKRIAYSLSFRGELFLTNLLHQEGVYQSPDAIDILMKTNTFTRLSILKELEGHIKENLFTTRPSSRNLLENIDIQNLLTNEDFTHLFFLAIHKKDSGVLFLFKKNHEIRLGLLDGISSFAFKHMAAIEHMFVKSVKHGLQDAIEMFGETSLISRTVLMHSILGQFGLGPFANRNEYTTIKSILINANLVSVLTSADLQVILMEALERKYFRFILDMTWYPMFLERISTRALSDMKMNAESMRIEWWNSMSGQGKVLESLRGRVVGQLKNIIQRRSKEHSEAFWM